ncbi:hypothetical protein N7E81_08160 [Reichenbachiella carrageenanivorans]|uniref:Uncharacterized protein n=1 Tax=Reichenbachiella carrageenanivorans TaxID=2979869 RepID=A0ABY6D4J0_9BACT|nr:DUF6607 family protein [Reichenbachiella carrageenanivorans]UXX81072.1 hypothetical protein N7E81_08160 [Reichenbachiella carrageenanivorans]
MKKVMIGLLLISTTVAYGQKQKKEDIAAIKAMCGCYDIRFNFAETFAPDKDYEFHENYTSGALEYVFPISEDKDKIVLQHLLVIGDTMIIKHWRQDWLYENTDFYVFDKENTWKYVSKTPAEVKGQWTQKVYQVDDSPRYEGSATWVHVDGKDYWESKADAPLPRREFSKRKDYNVMTRVNRQEITDYGWVHEQDNDKIIRSEDGDILLAQEKGWNTYTKTDDSKCDVAKAWWDTNQAYWADVRLVWDELFAQNKTLAINMKVDDKIMFQRLFALEKEMIAAQPYDSGVAQSKIKEAIQKHLKSDQMLTSLK